MHIHTHKHRHTHKFSLHAFFPCVTVLGMNHGTYRKVWNEMSKQLEPLQRTMQTSVYSTILRKRNIDSLAGLWSGKNRQTDYKLNGLARQSFNLSSHSASQQVKAEPKTSKRINQNRQQEQTEEGCSHKGKIREEEKQATQQHLL